MIKKKRKLKKRNYVAVAALKKTGSGKHKDKKSYDRKNNKKVISDE
jgi:hypothetical protein